MGILGPSHDDFSGARSAITSRTWNMERPESFDFPSISERRSVYVALRES